MLRALYTAAAGMTAQQLNVDVIANNLANVNSSGFKRSRVDFQDVLYQTERVPGAANSRNSQLPTGTQVGLGARASAVYKNFVQGTIQATGGKFDVAVQGEGFFQVLLPSGQLAYTRDGSFKVDQQGSLVTADGSKLQPEIQVPRDADKVTIGQDGTVSVTQPGQTASQEVGKIEIARFVNPAGLESVGGNLFISTTASGEPITGTPGLEGLGTLAHGYLEGSNVKVVEEMVQMITALRAYEVNSKAIQTSDEMLQIANNIRR